MEKFKMEISLNVLNHLGINLYSNVPAVISEVVANSWDASATIVDITINEEESTIVITDDGTGMDVEDINEKYLVIGYQKREAGHVAAEKFKHRKVMGRKGIGKLSLFSIADKIEVYSKKNGATNGFLLDAEEIRHIIKSNSKDAYYPQELDTTLIDLKEGTKIILRDLKKNISKAKGFLKKRLARRFSVIGDGDNFAVRINGENIEVSDRDYFHKVEYLWFYGDKSKKYIDLCGSRLKEHFSRTPDVSDKWKISGWLGLVEHSGDLQSKDENINKIVLLIRGKLAKEDLLEEFGEGGLYSKFLFGEIQADFLDEDLDEDITTSSRQAIKEEDGRYLALKDFLFKELKNIQNKRAELKNKEGKNQAFKIEPIKKWYNGLEKDRKSKAKKLFGDINQLEIEQDRKKQFFSHAVLAFESLKYRDSLNKLETVDANNVESFLSVFKDYDEIEAGLYYKITKERIEIIKNLKQKIKEDVLEKVLQEYLYEHLWLLDPSWDRATNNAVMEATVKKMFNEITDKLTEEEKKARIDIWYKTPHGKHLIIELKRRSAYTDFSTLVKQLDKYRRALKKIINSRTNSSNEPYIETICIIGKPMSGWEDLSNEQEDRKTFAQKNIRIITYDSLLDNAFTSYKAYLEKSQKVGKLIELIKEIEDYSFNES